MNRWKLPGIMALILCLVFIVAWAIEASADYLQWDAPTTFVDQTAIPDNVLQSMKYYVRTNQPNTISTTPDLTGKYYIGESTGGTVYWPTDNNVDGRIRDGETLTFTVTAAYKDANGAWQESVPSAGLDRTRPFVSRGLTKPPTGLRWSK